MDLSTLTPHQIVQFNGALLMASQQITRRIATKIDFDLNYPMPTAEGAPYVVELGGRVEINKLLTDDQKTDLKDRQKKRRLNYWQGRELTLRIGDFERVEQLVDPQNQAIMEMAAAGARSDDEDALLSLFEPMTETVIDPGTGKGVTSTLTFPNDYKIPMDFDDFHINEAEGGAAPASPGFGLTVNKLSEAKVLLDRGNYHEIKGNGMPVCFVEEEDLQFLQTSERIYNKESHYAIDAAMRDIGTTGEMVYNGIRFCKVNAGMLPRAQTQNTNTYWIPIFYPSALHFRKIPLIYGGDGMSMPKIDFRPDRSNIRQAMLKYYVTWARTHDEAVVHIECQRRA